MRKRPAQRRRHHVRPTDLYTRAEVGEILGLTERAVGQEVQSGRLLCSKRCGRSYFLGEWLLEWVKAGVVLHRARAAKAGEVA